MAKQAKRGSYLDVSGDSLQGFELITASKTLSAASPKQGYVSSPAAAVTVTLPTTDVKAGFVYKLDVEGATETNFVRLNSSGGNEIDRIGGEGFIQVMALQDSPTTAAHWRVVNIYVEAVWTPSVDSTLNVTGTPTFSDTSYTRIGNTVFVRIKSINNCRITTAGSRFGIIINPIGLPKYQNNSIPCSGAGRAGVTTSPNELLPLAISANSSGDDKIFIGVGFVTALGVVSNDLLFLDGIGFSYRID